MLRRAVLICCLAAAGCRGALLPGGGAWLTSPADGVPAIAAESRPAEAPKTLPLELSFVRYEPQDTVLHEELWTFVDEQSLGVDIRRRLHANGLRCGTVTGDLPAHLSARLEAAVAIDASDPRSAGTRKLLRLLPGRRAEIVAATGLPELVLVERHDEGVRGGTYRDATALFTIEARPAAGGRVRIEAVPEIRHGPLHRTWVGEEGMFRLETGQRRHRLEELGIAATLPERGMLVIGSTGDAASTAGDSLLGDRDPGDAGNLRLLVIRPLSAAADPWFEDPAGSNEPAGRDAG